MQAYRCRRIREEIANSVTHGAGLAFSVFACILLLGIAVRRGEMVGFVSALLYSGSLVALYLASTLYHAARRPRRKHAMRLLDHCAIYLLIAGSYTPFLLMALPPGIGWTFFAFIWTCAIAGVLMKILHSHRSTKFSTYSYLFLGWVSLFAIKPLYDHLPSECFWLLVGGGVAYTSGTWFFLRDRRLFFHAIWHLFVLGGSICHYAAILSVFLTAT